MGYSKQGMIDLYDELFNDPGFSKLASNDFLTLSVNEVTFFSELIFLRI